MHLQAKRSGVLTDTDQPSDHKDASEKIVQSSATKTPSPALKHGMLHEVI